MQNRIDRLEGLVLSLMTNGNETNAGAATGAGDRNLSMSISSQSQDFNSPSHQQLEESFTQEEEEGSETDRVAQSFGVLNVYNGKTMYLGEAHWAAILADVSYSPLSCTSQASELNPCLGPGGQALLVGA